MKRRENWKRMTFLAALLILAPTGTATTNDDPVTFDDPSMKTAKELQAGSETVSEFEHLVPPSRRISLDFQNAQIHTILRSFSEVGGVNIVTSPDVKGRSTVTLTDVPWSTALRLVLRANGLAAVEDDGVLRVNTEQGLANEELTRRSAERRREELLPLETRMLHLVYAKADELKPSLERMLSARGTMEVDIRTNTLLVVDVAPFVERIADLVEALDEDTPQVEITAKLVDVDTAVLKDLGVDWEATGNTTTDGIDVTGTAGVTAGLADAAGTLRVVTSGMDGDLDVTLQAMQRDNRANIISNPRITTLDNQPAKILVGKKIPLVVTDEAGNAITQLTTIGIKMQVTPHINSDDWITLDLNPEVSDLSAQATVQGGIIIVTAEASTRVRVRDGQTAVIGGLIRQNENEFITGVPLLKDLPLLGSLFRSSSTSTEERELIIFVTPRIVRHG